MIFFISTPRMTRYPCYNHTEPIPFNQSPPGVKLGVINGLPLMGDLLIYLTVYDRQKLRKI